MAFQTVAPKTEKDLFLKVSRKKRETVTREVSREPSVQEDEGQKYMVAYCSDRSTENRYKQFCTESQPSLEASGVF